MSKISRRKFITTVGATAATAAVLHACSSSDQATTSAPDSESAASVAASGTVAPADTPEVTTAKLGFIALTDAAPLIVAKEKACLPSMGWLMWKSLSRLLGEPRATTWCWDPLEGGLTVLTFCRRWST